MLRNVRLNEVLDGLQEIHVCRGLTFDGNGDFIVAFIVNLEKIEKLDVTHVHEGNMKPGTNGWVLKMTVDTAHLNTQETKDNQGALFQFKDYREKSILLKNEYAEGYNGIIEFKKDHFLIALGWFADLLIVQNWIVTKKIVDP